MGMLLLNSRGQVTNLLLASLNTHFTTLNLLPTTTFPKWYTTIRLNLCTIILLNQHLATINKSLLPTQTKQHLIKDKIKCKKVITSKGTPTGACKRNKLPLSSSNGASSQHCNVEDLYRTSTLFNRFHKRFCIMHVNIRSLQKNLQNLKDLLCDIDIGYEP